jgi:hypothetical protein
MCYHTIILPPPPLRMRQLPVGLLLTGLLSSSLAELWGTSGTGSETGLSEFTGKQQYSSS